MLADEIEQALATLRNPARAAGEKAYLKSDLVFWGTGVPALRRVVNAALKPRTRTLTRTELLAAIKALWPRGIHELRGAAMLLASERVDLLTARDLPLLERMLRESKSWAYVDYLASHVMGPLVVRDPALGATLDRWARDRDFWLRRAAMLALLVPLREGGGDWERFARYADAMLDEKEFFIRKAIGWILRDTSRKRPDLVAAWLAPRRARASGVTLREADKYLRAGTGAAAGSGAPRAARRAARASTPPRSDRRRPR